MFFFSFSDQVVHIDYVAQTIRHIIRNCRTSLLGKESLSISGRINKEHHISQILEDLCIFLTEMSSYLGFQNYKQCGKDKFG